MSAAGTPNGNRQKPTADPAVDIKKGDHHARWPDRVVPGSWQDPRSHHAGKRHISEIDEAGCDQNQAADTERCGMPEEKAIVSRGPSTQRYELLVQRAYDKAYQRSDEAQVLATLALAEATILAARHDG